MTNSIFIVYLNFSFALDQVSVLVLTPEEILQLVLIKVFITYLVLYHD